MKARESLVNTAKYFGMGLAVLLVLAAGPLARHALSAMGLASRPAAQVAPIAGTRWSVVKSNDLVMVTTMRAFRNVQPAAPTAGQAD